MGDNLKYKRLIISIVAVMILFLMVLPEATAGTPIFSEGEIAHAKAVHAQHLEKLMGLPGVHGVGIGEEFGHIGILILVDDESRTPHMPKTIEDMPGIVRAVGEITAHQIDLGVDGGNNIVCNNYCASGTVGFKVCDNTTSGVGGFITNNHVAATGCPGLCPNKAPIGTDFFSPSFCDGGTANVGTLNRFIPIVLDNTTLNYVDAAFLQSTDAQVSNNIQGIGPQNNAVITAYLGQPVCKSGRTSGLTCGTVTGINLTISINYNGVGQCGSAILSNQIMYSPTSPYTIMSQSGDSGSPVVEAKSNVAVALNFAGDQSGDGFGNPIETVLSALQVSLCGNILPSPVLCKVDIYIAGMKKDSYTISPGQSVTPQHAGAYGGPVHIVSDRPVFASERSLYGSSFNEVMGYPADLLTTEYWFPIYDNKYMQTWILVGNPSSTDTATVDIYIAGTKKGSYTISPGQSEMLKYAGAYGGPVQVVSTNQVPVFTSERSLYGSSFNEVMGYPTDQLTTEYWFPIYDNKYMQTWILVGNPSSTDATVDIYIAGNLMPGSPYTLQAGKSWTPQYAGAYGGPVHIVSDQPVFASERSLYGSSFNEVMGYPADLLTTEYWFPIYDNKYMQTWILVGTPN